MTRRSTRLVTLVGVVFGLVALTAIAATAAPTVTDNGTDASPGTDASGTIGSQGATIGTEIRLGSFETRFSNADSPSARAQVIAGELDRTERQVRTLESRLETLTTQRERDTIDQGTYESRSLRISSSARTQAAVLDRIQRRATDVDATALERAEVTTERIERLRSRTEELVAAGGEGATSRLEPEFYRQVRTVATGYNEDVASQDLGVLGAYLDNERVNLHVVRTDGETEVVSFRTTADTRVRELRAGPHPDASVRVTVDESTARNIVQSDDPGEQANDAFLDGEIDVDGLGRYNALRWTIVKVALFIVQVIGALVSIVVGVIP